ncbi:MAG: hypothetical protein HS104_09650 [Polyangiaceae bacterium]|nr:hypothetical protein [Polyangiaceae bacterium]MCL4754351.1 hypothetical protein [Myxococcales bacterium]
MEIPKHSDVPTDEEIHRVVDRLTAANRNTTEWLAQLDKLGVRGFATTAQLLRELRDAAGEAVTLAETFARFLPADPEA